MPSCEHYCTLAACLGDANYDTEEILSYIFIEMKAEPMSRPSGNTLKEKDDHKGKNGYPIRVACSLGEEISEAIFSLPRRPSQVHQPKGLQLSHPPEPQRS